MMTMIIVRIILQKHCFDPSSLSSTHTSDSASEQRLILREINVFIIREKERKRERDRGKGVARYGAQLTALMTK